MKIAIAVKGYKDIDTYAAKERLIKRFENKLNHPFLEKDDYDATKHLISKPESLNISYGKTHLGKAIDLATSKRFKNLNDVSFYGLDKFFIKKKKFAFYLD